MQVIIGVWNISGIMKNEVVQIEKYLENIKEQ